MRHNAGYRSIVGGQFSVVYPKMNEGGVQVICYELAKRQRPKAIRYSSTCAAMFLPYSDLLPNFFLPTEQSFEL